MRTDTLTLAKALDLLARDTICEDGIATAAMQEAAERLRDFAKREWQPIASMPRNGDLIDLWHPDLGTDYACWITSNHATETIKPIEEYTHWRIADMDNGPQ